MVCKRCGSTRVNIETINERSYKPGRGCLFTVLFMYIYIPWLLIKWGFKFIVLLAYWTFWGWWRFIADKYNGKVFVKPYWLEKLMRRRGKVYNRLISVAVCQDCGYRHKIR